MNGEEKGNRNQTQSWWWKVWVLFRTGNHLVLTAKDNKAEKTPSRSKNNGNIFWKSINKRIKEGMMPQQCAQCSESGLGSVQGSCWNFCSPSNVHIFKFIPVLFNPISTLIGCPSLIWSLFFVLLRLDDPFNNIGCVTGCCQCKTKTRLR